LAWIADHAPRVVVSIEGPQLRRRARPSRHCRRPGGGRVRAATRNGRCGRDKSDLIARYSPRCARTPTGYPNRGPMVTGKRCGSCSALATSSPWQAPPRPTDCVCCWPAETPNGALARATLTDSVLVAVARRQPRDASREQAVCYGEIRRLALAVRAAGVGCQPSPPRNRGRTRASPGRPWRCATQADVRGGSGRCAASEWVCVRHLWSCPERWWSSGSPCSAWRS
jgi:hypothetical protein